MNHNNFSDILVVDTSVFISAPDIFFEVKNSVIFIPIEVIEELDNQKTRKDKVGAAARKVNRTLDSLRKNGDLRRGVDIGENNLVVSTLKSNMSLLPEGFENSNDNKIISVALYLRKKGAEVVCLSNDLALRIKCGTLGIEADEYTSVKKSKEDSENFMGIKEIPCLREEVDEFYEDKSITLEGENFYPNEGVLLKSEMSSGLGISDGGDHVRALRFASKKDFNVQGIRPRSKEQTIALELLMDPEIHMVSLTGMAGCGKTLLAVAASIDHLFAKRYKKLIISRPVQSMSKDIGYLPGTKEEKLQPWVQPILDNIEVIFSKKSKSYFETMMKKGEIELEALSHIRGRTLPDTIFIIDEAQNITHHEAKAILTRMGENSKIILIGDLDQIDSPNVSENSSGLYSVINLFKQFERSGHVTLIKGERSELASYAAEVM